MTVPTKCATEQISDEIIDITHTYSLQNTVDKVSFLMTILVTYYTSDMHDSAFRMKTKISHSNEKNVGVHSLHPFVSSHRNFSFRVQKNRSAIESAKFNYVFCWHFRSACISVCVDGVNISCK